jgi:hypothetical protein
MSPTFHCSVNKLTFLSAALLMPPRRQLPRPTRYLLLVAAVRCGLKLLGPPLSFQSKWQLLHISTLREYLRLEFTPTSPLPFPFDVERLIDDWVCLCFFVGNDFLPHLPSFDINEGAIEILFSL